MEIKEENYHSVEARKEYMGYSQFKKFLECEKGALDYVNGIEPDIASDALTIGTIVDETFSGTIDAWKLKHPEIYNSKTGTLLKKYEIAEKVIEVTKADENMMKMLSGEHQVIFEGTIEDVKCKIKIDSLHRGKYIIDQKVMRSLDPVWIEENGRNKKVGFWKAFRYDLEAYFYQTVYEQATGERLPFILAVTTKEDTPRKALLEIPQEIIDKAGEEVRAKIKRFDDIKKGLIQPNECGHCHACLKDKMVTGIFPVTDFDPKEYHAEDVEF